MAQSAIACPKCNQQMQEGYLREEARLARWYEGPPRRLARNDLGRVGDEAVADHSLSLPVLRLPRILRQGQVAQTMRASEARGHAAAPAQRTFAWLRAGIALPRRPRPL